MTHKKFCSYIFTVHYPHINNLKIICVLDCIVFYCSSRILWIFFADILLHKIMLVNIKADKLFEIQTFEILISSSAEALFLDIYFFSELL